MQRILVPTDFSKESENAIQTGLLIARAFDATLIILHVLEISSKSSINASGDLTRSGQMIIHEGLKLAQNNLNRSMTLHGLDKTDIKVERYIRIGSVKQQIEDSIARENIDFLIMGTKSAWGMNDILLGTATDKLLRRVDCPVLSVNQVVSVEMLQKIVFPTTTLNKENNLLEVIRDFQQKFNSKIYLLRVNTPGNFMPDQEALQLLKDYADEHELMNFETHVYSHTDEEDGIREFAEKIKGGLIAVATSAHTGLWKIVQGSVTKELVNHSKRPVLTVRMD